MMTESILNGKKILLVDDEIDVMMLVEEEILYSCPHCHIDKAGTYEEAAELLKSRTYDVILLDIMGIRGFDLLKLAVSRNFKVAMLTVHALTPEALKKSIEMSARAYLPKERLGEIVPFLEDILTYEYLPGWKRVLSNLGEFYNTRWGEEWQKPEAKFWKKFQKNKSSTR